MKRTKRQENAIIINFSLYAILFLVSLLALGIYLYPNILSIENIKAETKKTYEDLTNMEKNGLSFKQFKASVKTAKIEDLYKDQENVNLDYIKGILNEIDEDFYNENFKNKTKEGKIAKSYLNFLVDLKNEYRNNKDLEEKFRIISKILPSYSENIYEIDENSLTDFKFINYIESLAYNFNLLYSNSIGINGVTLLPNYSVLSSDGSLDKNIYYINLELNIVGKKSSIIDFIYYLQNVGKVKINEEGELEIVKKDFVIGDDFYNFKFKKLLEKEDEIKKDYNIFNNQIAEIQDITFKEDIDSNFKPTVNIGSSSLINYLKNTDQMDEKFEARFNLRFYVKGLSKYKIEEFIDNFVEKYEKTDKELKKLLKDTRIKSVDKRKLEAIEKSLKQSKNFIKNLGKNKKR